MQDAICFSRDLRKSPAGENKTVEGTRKANCLVVG